MLVCGDFNSVPGSAPHALLALRKVDHMHPLILDPLRILCLATNSCIICHCAYSSFARIGSGLGFEQQRRRMDPNTNEPLFTNCTRDLLVPLIKYFTQSLLELLDEDSLSKDTALPSPEWSSDHIAVLAEFRCKPQARLG